MATKIELNHASNWTKNKITFNWLSDMIEDGRFKLDIIKQYSYQESYHKYDWNNFAVQLFVCNVIFFHLFDTTQMLTARIWNHWFIVHHLSCLNQNQACSPEQKVQKCCNVKKGDIAYINNIKDYILLVAFFLVEHNATIF